MAKACYKRGPFLQAFIDAAAIDESLEHVWRQFLADFDEATCARIEADQKQGLIPQFDARPVAYAARRP